MITVSVIAFGLIYIYISCLILPIGELENTHYIDIMGAYLRNSDIGNVKASRRGQGCN